MLATDVWPSIRSLAESHKASRLGDPGVRDDVPNDESAPEGPSQSEGVSERAAPSRHPEHAIRPASDCAECRAAFQVSVLEGAATNRRSFPWRRSERTSYELVVAELLLQQTRAEQAAKIFPALVHQCPDWLGLAGIPRADLEELLRPLGLQRRRAAALQALAQRVLQRGLPATASELEALPGVGQYMARAIAAQLSNEVVAPIDTNVTRVLERVFGPRKLADIRHDRELQRLALALVPATNSGGYLIALLDFAAAICRPRAPRCGDCPLPTCRYRSESLESVPTDGRESS